MKRPLAIATVGLAITVVLAVSACAQNANSAGTATSAAKSITLVSATGGNTLDPAEAQDLTSDELTLATYDTLVEYKVANGAQVAGQYTPSLASSWSTSPNGLTWTFHLRTDVTFASGNKLTSADVLYSFARVKASTAASTLYTLADIASVSAPNASTVVVTLSKPNPGLLDYIGMYTFGIVDAKTVEAQSDPNAWLKTHTAGSGPYIIDSWNPTTEIVLTARKGYWGKAPAISKVTIEVVPQVSTQLQQLTKGSVQLVTSVPVQNISSLEADKDLKVIANPSGYVDYLALNNDVKPFTSQLVREALSYAVPYSDLVKTVLLGYGTALKSAISPITPYYNPSTDPYTYDPAKAKQLLAEAGFPHGFTFSTIVDSSIPTLQQAAVIIQSAFKSIGVTMNIQTLADQQDQSLMQAGKQQSYFSTWISFINQPGYHLGFLLQSQGSANWVHYDSPQVDDLMAKAAVDTNSTTAQQLWTQVQKDITDDAPWIYLFSQDNTAAMASDVGGYASYVDTMVRFKNLYYTN